MSTSKTIFPFNASCSLITPAESAFSLFSLLFGTIEQRVDGVGASVEKWMGMKKSYLDWWLDNSQWARVERERKIFGWIRDQERYTGTLFVRRSRSETIRGNEDERKSSLNTRSLRFQPDSGHWNVVSSHNRALWASVERQCSPWQRLFKHIPERKADVGGRATKSQPNWISEWGTKPKFYSHT